MEIFIASLLFILGTIVASFVGVVSGRLHTGEGFLTGRSRCDACGRPLTPLSLVPIVSYLVARGRARCCGARLALLAPLSELILGILFVLTYFSLGLTLSLLLFLISLSLLLALTLYDLTHQILPPSLLIPFVLVSAATLILLSEAPPTFFSSLLTATLIAAFLALIHVVSRGRAMGLSDAPLAFGLALLVGSAALSGFIFSFWIGAIVGIGILARRPVGSRIGVEVPFAPFLALGFLLAFFTKWNPFTLIAALLS